MKGRVATCTSCTGKYLIESGARCRRPTLLALGTRLPDPDKCFVRRNTIGPYGLELPFARASRLVPDATRATACTRSASLRRSRVRQFYGDRPAKLNMVAGAEHGGERRAPSSATRRANGLASASASEGLRSQNSNVLLTSANR